MKLFWKHDSRLYEAMFYYNQDVRFLLCLQGTAWLDTGASMAPPPPPPMMGSQVSCVRPVATVAKEPLSQQPAPWVRNSL